VRKHTFFVIGQWILIIIGCSQMAGYIFNNRALRGLGLAYGTAPLPTVFSTVEGVEGFDTKHTIYFTTVAGKKDSVAFDQILLDQFHGHYFLKNAYSIFIAYPHILKPQQITDGWAFALCKRNLLDQCNMDTQVQEPYVQTKRSYLNKVENVQSQPQCNKN
jgi:hypothetical protein